MKIPNDLKPGEVIIDQYGKRHTVQNHYGSNPYDGTDIWTIDTPESLVGVWFKSNGNAWGRDFIATRIERIPSAPAKAKRAKASAADRLIAIANRCVGYVNPTVFAGELAKTKPMTDCYLNTLLRRAVNAAKRERAIARRLEGDGK